MTLQKGKFNPQENQEDLSSMLGLLVGLGVLKNLGTMEMPR